MRREISSESEDPQPALFEAEAAGVLRRAHGHAVALGAALDEAANAIACAGLKDVGRQLDKLRELERLVAVRVDLLARRVAEGPPCPP